MKVRTLVVDDDVAVAGVHKGFLEAHGSFEVVGLAHTADDAVSLALELEPELILLDIYLPDRSGLEVLRELRAADLPVDVIAITAAREIDTVRAAMAGGVLHYLVKPFSVAVLHGRLDEYMAGRDASRRLEEAELDQSAIDRLMRVRSASNAPAPLPKGLSSHTLQLVQGAVAGSDTDLSASEVGAATGLSRVSARRYLEYLVETGQVTVHPRYGSSGRPEHGFRVSGT